MLRISLPVAASAVLTAADCQADQSITRAAKNSSALDQIYPKMQVSIVGLLAMFPARQLHGWQPIQEDLHEFLDAVWI
jgi:hypothetical protein